MRDCNNICHSSALSGSHCLRFMLFAFAREACVRWNSNDPFTPMSGRAPRYEQVATSEGTAASSLPAARTWSARGNLWKMFIALIVVVGVYVSFTLVREQAAIGASSDDGNAVFIVK